MLRQLSVTALIIWALQVSVAVAQEHHDPDENIKIAHAVLGSLAWVIFFPLGSILIRLLHGPHTVWIHASIQAFSLILFIVSVGIGIRLALDKDEIDEYHPIIGLVLFAMLFLQAAGGLLHHLLFKRKGHRTVVSYVHIWTGRALITLGMINGGLGLLLAGDADRSEYIAYGVVAGIIWVIWVGVDIFATFKGHSDRSPPKYEKDRNMSMSND